MGRRSKLTPELQATICGHIANGLTFKDAFTLSGVSSAAFYRWRQRGEEAQSGRYREFVEALKGAESSFRDTHLSVIRRAATEPSETIKEHVKRNPDGTELKEVTRTKHPPAWAPSAWLLERKYPGEFGRRVIEHDGKVDGGGPAQVRVEFVGASVDSDIEVTTEGEDEG